MEAGIGGMLGENEGNNIAIQHSVTISDTAAAATTAIAAVDVLATQATTKPTAATVATTKSPATEATKKEQQGAGSSIETAAVARKTAI